MLLLNAHRPSRAPCSRVCTTRVFPLTSLLAAVALSALSACSTVAPPTEPPPPPSYETLLDNGNQAKQAGKNEEAVAAWRQAAKQNPAAKEPWLRMAQLHFDNGDYGSAISEAQETLQRDNTDAIANGLLAVSGLRVSSQALARMHTNELQGSTRGEAENLAKTLRDLLGTPVLVPPPEAPVAKPRARPARHAATPAAAVTPAPKAKPAASNDPFSALR